MKATIYSKDNCPWCEKAKAIFVSKDIEYDEFLLNRDYTPTDFKSLFPNSRTVPQISIDGNYVGGHDDLVKYIESHGI